MATASTTTYYLDEGDKNQPYAYAEWVARTSFLGDKNKHYARYLNDWYVGKDRVAQETTDATKESYLEFVKSIITEYDLNGNLTKKPINYDDLYDLNRVIAHASTVLIDRVKMVKKKRATARQTRSIYENRGTNQGVKLELEDMLLNSFYDTDGLSQNYSLTANNNNLTVRIDELYDISDDYFNSFSEKDIGDYVALTIQSQYEKFVNDSLDELRAKQQSRFVAATDQLLFDAATKTQLEYLNNNLTLLLANSNSDYLETGANEQLIVGELIEVLSDFPSFVLADYQGSADNVKNVLQLYQRYIGVDMYYHTVAADGTISQGKLISSLAPNQNLLNINKISFATIPNINPNNVDYSKLSDTLGNLLSTSDDFLLAIQNLDTVFANLRSVSEIGGHFVPSKLSVNFFTNKNFTTTVDTVSSEIDKVYLYPDPTLIANPYTQGSFVKESGLTVKDDNSWSVYGKSYGGKIGHFVDEPSNLIDGYLSKQEKNQNSSSENTHRSLRTVAGNETAINQTHLTVGHQAEYNFLWLYNTGSYNIDWHTEIGSLIVRDDIVGLFHTGDIVPDSGFSLSGWTDFYRIAKGFSDEGKPTFFSLGERDYGLSADYRISPHVSISSNESIASAFLFPETQNDLTIGDFFTNSYYVAEDYSRLANGSTGLSGITDLAFIDRSYYGGPAVVAYSISANRIYEYETVSDKNGDFNNQFGLPYVYTASLSALSPSLNAYSSIGRYRDTIYATNVGNVLYFFDYNYYSSGYVNAYVNPTGCSPSVTGTFGAGFMGGETIRYLRYSAKSNVFYAITTSNRLFQFSTNEADWVDADTYTFTHLFTGSAFNDGVYGSFAIDPAEEYFYVNSGGVLYKVDFNGKRIDSINFGTDVNSGGTILGSLFDTNQNEIITMKNTYGMRKIVFRDDQSLGLVGDVVSRNGSRALHNTVREWIAPNGTEYLILNTEFGPYSAVIDYFKNILSQPQYRAHQIVFITHAMGAYDNDFVQSTYSGKPSDYVAIDTPTTAYTGQELWDNFVKLYPNFRLVLSSHVYDGTDAFDALSFTKTGDEGNTVQFYVRNNYKNESVAYSSIGFDSVGNIYIDDVEVNKGTTVFYGQTPPN